MMFDTVEALRQGCRAAGARDEREVAFFMEGFQMALQMALENPELARHVAEELHDFVFEETDPEHTLAQMLLEEVATSGHPERD